jgi:hypothetical protein
MLRSPRFPSSLRLPQLLICLGMLAGRLELAEAQQDGTALCGEGWAEQMEPSVAATGHTPNGTSAGLNLDIRQPALTAAGPAAVLPTPQPNAIRALAGITFVNMAGVGINHLARSIPGTNPSTWWRNVQGGWTWDGNNISTNNIEHPYGGAVYFNIARANGLSFWASAPMAVVGSLEWELFGESTPPSKNDLLVTSMSGIAMGEAIRRLSFLLLDNEARGLDRVWREAMVLVMNPGMGLNRLSRGDTWHHLPNPAEHRPRTLRTSLAVGARKLTVEQAPAVETIGLAFGAFGLEVGDPFSGAKVHPFSNFTFTTELSSGPTTTLTQLGTRGMLSLLGRRDGPTDHVTGLFLDFEYQWNESYQFSEQSFGVGALRKSGSGDWRLHTDISAEFVPLLASSDLYAEDRVLRAYDYGAGIGGRAMAHLEHRGVPILSASYRGFWTATVNGASRTKLIQFGLFEARTPAMLGLSLGASYAMYHQRSVYTNLPTASESLPSFSLFISTAN